MHVGGVQSRGRLVQNIYRAAGRAAGQLGRQLDPLRLTAGQRGGGLSQLDIAETHVMPVCAILR